MGAVITLRPGSGFHPYKQVSILLVMECCEEKIETHYKYGWSMDMESSRLPDSPRHRPPAPNLWRQEKRMALLWRQTGQECGVDMVHRNARLKESIEEWRDQGQRGLMRQQDWETRWRKIIYHCNSTGRGHQK